MALSRAQVLAYFERNYYLENNPDLKNYFALNPSFDLFEHYYSVGIKEGRIASPNFNQKAYLDNNPDLKSFTALNPGFNLLEHYITAGIREGRKATETIKVNNYDQYHSSSSTHKSNFDNNLKVLLTKPTKVKKDSGTQRHKDSEPEKNTEKHSEPKPAQDMKFSMSQYFTSVNSLTPEKMSTVNFLLDDIYKSKHYEVAARECPEGTSLMEGFKYINDKPSYRNDYEKLVNEKNICFYKEDLKLMADLMNLQIDN